MRRQALVVGVEGTIGNPTNETPPKWRPLMYAAPCAQHLREVLGTQYAYLLLEPDPDPASTAAALGEALTKAVAGDADFTVIHLLAHGEPTRNSHGLQAVGGDGQATETLTRWIDMAEERETGGGVEPSVLLILEPEHRRLRYDLHQSPVGTHDPAAIQRAVRTAPTPVPNRPSPPTRYDVGGLRTAAQAVQLPTALGGRELAFATAGAACAVAGVALAQGQIDAGEFATRSAEATLQIGLGWACGAVAQTIIPMPVVEALVGGLVGQAAGTLIAQGLQAALVAVRGTDGPDAELLERELLTASLTSGLLGSAAAPWARRRARLPSCCPAAGRTGSG